MSRTLPFLLLLMIVAGQFACTDEALELSNTPEIEFLSISPPEVIAYQERVVIRIKYVDGNGAWERTTRT